MGLIGVFHSPHRQMDGTPIQAAPATGVRSTGEVFPEYATGLLDLDGFERIWLVYWFDRAKPAELVVTPDLDTTPRGPFATRAPCRPNPIGLSCVRLLEVRGNILHVEGLDIKPYLPASRRVVSFILPLEVAKGRGYLCSPFSPQARSANQSIWRR